MNDFSNRNFSKFPKTVSNNCQNQKSLKMFNKREFWEIHSVWQNARHKPAQICQNYLQLLREDGFQKKQIFGQPPKAYRVINPMVEFLSLLPLLNTIFSLHTIFLNLSPFYISSYPTYM